jgi:ATP-dependent helicase HrpB
VLATSIAETSITIDGVRIVIDSGWQRLPRFEPSTGITRLETVRVSQASAAQRAGRAGRTGPGLAIRLWRAEQTAALPAFTPPEILASDLSGLLLNCAAWGVDGPDRLALLDAPPVPAVREARALLIQLGALDGQGGITPLGRRVQAMGLPARLGAMVAAAETADKRLAAAELAMLLTEQGLGGPGHDLSERRRNLSRDRQPRAKAARDMARRLAGAGKSAGDGVDDDAGLAGRLLLKAYPDRIALQKGAVGRYVMANGRAALLDETDPLARSRFLVVADLTGASSGHRILAAAALDEEDVTAFAETHGETRTDYEFDDGSRSVRVRETRRLGALVLGERALPPDDETRVAETLAQGLRRLGLDVLPWSKDAQQLRDRLAFLHGSLGDPWTDVSDDALLAALHQWFIPFQAGVRSLGSISPRSLIDGLLALVPYDLQRAIEREAPTHFTVPTGNRIAIRYDCREPVLAVRVQELFGMKEHPTIAGGRPLLLELLSPAQRPIQTTRDLPGFWQGSWADVRREMRGRYPRHPWPEDPANAAPTQRAKPRGE